MSQGKSPRLVGTVPSRGGHENALERRGTSVGTFEEVNAKFQATVETLGIKTEKRIRTARRWGWFHLTSVTVEAFIEVPNAPSWDNKENTSKLEVG
jgi:hypothetical protein